MRHSSSSTSGYLCSFQGVIRKTFLTAVVGSIIVILIFQSVLPLSMYYQNEPQLTSTLKEILKDEVQKGLKEIVAQEWARLNSGNIVNNKPNSAYNNTYAVTDLSTTTLYNTGGNFVHITPKPNLSMIINASSDISTIYAPYLLENPDFCSSVRNLTMLVIVHTAIDHFDRRLAFRRTWTNQAFYKTPVTVKTLFLLGKPKDQNKQKTIEQEFNRYRDILQGDFLDTYHNLTLKGVMAYKWLTERCRNAKIILKVDDDVMVDMDRFLDYILPEYWNKTRQISCNYRLEGKAPIFRSNHSKWYVHDAQFKGLRHYPTTYCYGYFVVFSNDLLPALYRSAKVTPFFWVDDVYLYGLVPGNVPGVTYTKLDQRWNLHGAKKVLRCFEDGANRCDNIVTIATKMRQFDEVWSNIVRRHKK